MSDDENMLNHKDGFFFDISKYTKPNEWIKTSERLPNENQRCWIVTRYNSHFDYVVDARFNINDFWNEDHDYNLKDVSYWQPYYTPKPPKD